MTFYRKYRSQTLEELDLTEVRESLKKIVDSGKIPHALLFSGPKGTGKTSAARILAKVLNCEKNEKKLSEPCNKCDQCVAITKGNNIDVIELDAASHRGIDDIRALREGVALAPAYARKKVYIIDEAHMLTLEASNALLKTLEEPPEHVVFILATTNPKKLIETVRSRTINISFSKATTEEIVRSLARIVKGEKIKIVKDTVLEIAERATGSFRDAAKILEQIVSEGEGFLRRGKEFDVENFLATLAKRETREGLEEIKKAQKKGVGTEETIEAILGRLREGLLAEVGVGTNKLAGFNKNDLVYLIELFTRASNDLRDSPIEELPLEIAIVEWCEGVTGQSQSAHTDFNSASGKAGTELASSHSRDLPKSSNPAFDSASQVLPRTKNPDVREHAPAPSTRAEGKEITEEVWRRILAEVKPRNTSIEALLRAARPIGYDGKTLTLGVFYRFHKERLEEGRNVRILEEVVAQILGNPVKVVCTLTEPPKKEPARNATPRDAGGGTVLTEGEDADIIKIAEEIFGN